MAELFYLPKVTSLPGSKLYFFQTGSSTPQEVYQDAALNTAFTQPVEADISGVFAPIYLDPTLPDYRVSHYTSADVLIYTVDDVPSNQNTQQSMRLESTNPYVFLYDTDGTSGSRKYRIRAAGAAFEVQASNEAEAAFTTILRFESGILYSNETEVAVTSAGTFTGTLTGMTGSTTGTINYRRVNNIVTLWNTLLISGTSNTTDMTMTGLPVALRPTSSMVVSCSRLLDNSIEVEGRCGLGPSDTLTYQVSTVSGSKIIPSTFVNSGSKGLGVGWSITYPIS